MNVREDAVQSWCVGRRYFDDKYVDFQGGEGGARCCLWVLGQVKQMQFQGPVPCTCGGAFAPGSLKTPLTYVRVPRQGSYLPRGAFFCVCLGCRAGHFVVKFASGVRS